MWWVWPTVPIDLTTHFMFLIMMKKLSIVLLIALCQLATLAQSTLKSGPMLGYVDMREACVWVQTAQAQNVTLYYWPKLNHDKLVPKVANATTSAEQAFTAHLKLTELEPGVTYEYSFVPPADGLAKVYELTTQHLWQFRTDPPAFRVATGSCSYTNDEQYDRPGEPYGGSMAIFDSIAAKKPDMMLWLGDNIYLREVDYTSRSGILYRYTHMRLQPAMQRLMQTCPHYAIWDDHDYGPNDGDGSYLHKNWTLDAFKMFWANPSYGIPNTKDENTITTQFKYGDVDFFLLDNRTNRVVNGIELTDSSTILGKEQIDWLIQALKYSKAPFKMIAMGGQFLNTVSKFENYACYAKERQWILDAIEKNNITGVVFLTGDRHCAELSMIKLSNGIEVYDLTASPFTSKAYDNTKEENTLRVPGTLYAERNFATLDFSGALKVRKLTITLWNAKGEKMWAQEIEQSKSK